MKRTASSTAFDKEKMTTEVMHAYSNGYYLHIKENEFAECEICSEKELEVVITDGETDLCCDCVLEIGKIQKQSSDRRIVAIIQEKRIRRGIETPSQFVTSLNYIRLMKIYFEGAYFSPAGLAYEDKNRYVCCDLCGRQSLAECVNHGMKELCMSCINDISKGCFKAGSDGSVVKVKLLPFGNSC